MWTSVYNRCDATDKWIRLFFFKKSVYPWLSYLLFIICFLNIKCLDSCKKMWSLFWPGNHFITVESYLMTRNHFIVCVCIRSFSFPPLVLLTSNAALSLPPSCLLTCSSWADLLWKSRNLTKFKSSLKKQNKTKHYGMASGTAQEELRHASGLLAGDFNVDAAL